jgi:hypothetical protein
VILYSTYKAPSFYQHDLAMENTDVTGGKPIVDQSLSVNPLSPTTWKKETDAILLSQIQH